MKINLLTLLFCVALLAAANGQSTLNQNLPDAPTRSIPTGTGRDGFFVRDSHVFMVRNGVTTQVEREIIFPNGLRVLPNGMVTLRDGRERALLSKQWLTFEGSIDDAVIAAASPSPAKSRESGVSARDGITVSGADVFITRNGVTSKVTQEIRLSNGALVRPDGTVVHNGNKITLRADQVLGLDGVLHEAPVVPNPAGVAPSTNPAR
jgi:hypothetical protein